MQDQKLEGRQEHRHTTENAPTSAEPVREPAPPSLNAIPYVLVIWVLLGIGTLFVLRRKLV